MNNKNQVFVTEEQFDRFSEKIMNPVVENEEFTLEEEAAGKSEQEKRLEKRKANLFRVLSNLNEDGTYTANTKKPGKFVVFTKEQVKKLVYWYLIDKKYHEFKSRRSNNLVNRYGGDKNSVIENFSFLTEGDVENLALNLGTHSFVGKLNLKFEGGLINIPKRKDIPGQKKENLEIFAESFKYTDFEKTEFRRKEQKQNKEPEKEKSWASKLLKRKKGKERDKGGVRSRIFSILFFIFSSLFCFISIITSFNYFHHL